MLLISNCFNSQVLLLHQNSSICHQTFSILRYARLSWLQRVSFVLINVSWHVVIGKHTWNIRQTYSTWIIGWFWPRVIVWLQHNNWLWGVLIANVLFRYFTHMVPKCVIRRILRRKCNKLINTLYKVWKHQTIGLNRKIRQNIEDYNGWLSHWAANI